MRIITGAIVGESNSQQNATSNVNIEERHFSHFGTIGANPFREFRTFGEGNNNPPSGNNNNSPLSLLLSEFEEGLGGGFNLPSGGNARGLDPNITALVNVLTGANLRINYVERESNHVKPTEFRGIEAEDPNEWLECYNRIVEANK